MSPAKNRAGDRPLSRFARWRAGVADRLARSSRIFLIGVIIACGIEVIVDWNATLYEINVLRDGMRQRGQNYVSILSQAAVAPMLAYDADTMDALSEGLFDDEDVVFVRFADQLGVTVYDRLRPEFERVSTDRHGRAYRDHYGPQLDRDIMGILGDPEHLRRNIAASGHRDVFQLWNDVVRWVVGQVAGPKVEAPRAHGVLLYQDRLSDERNRHDSDLAWALGTIVDERGETWGAVLVAFSLDRTNAAIDKKLLKGLGMVLFFVGLIIVQNVLSRRDKLRLLDLETRYGNAKKALREALPSLPVPAPQRIGLSLDQAQGPVDGMVYDISVSRRHTDVLVVDPDGDGIDAASTALHILRVFRERRAQGVEASLQEEATALGAAALIIPLTRPIGLVYVRLHASGAVESLGSPLGTLWLAGKDGTRQVVGGETVQAPKGVVGPLAAEQFTLTQGSTLVAVCAGMETAEARKGIGPPSVAEYVSRTRQKGHVSFEDLAADATTWARGRMTGMATQDIVVVVIERPAQAPA